MGEVLQRPADARHRQPAAELRHHDGPAETAAVQEGGTGGAVDHVRPPGSTGDSFLSVRQVSSFQVCLSEEVLLLKLQQTLNL